MTESTLVDKLHIQSQYLRAELAMYRKPVMFGAISIGVLMETLEEAAEKIEELEAKLHVAENVRFIDGGTISIPLSEYTRLKKFRND